MRRSRSSLASVPFAAELPRAALQRISISRSVCRHRIMSRFPQPGCRASRNLPRIDRKTFRSSGALWRACSTDRPPEPERTGGFHGLTNTRTSDRAPLLWMAANRASPRVTHIRSRRMRVRSTRLSPVSYFQSSASGRRRKAVLPSMGLGQARSKHDPAAGVGVNAPKGTSSLISLSAP